MKRNTTYLYKSITLSAVMAVTGFFMFCTKAHATFISPPRVIIDANQVAGEMIILNRGNETLVYSFKWQDRAMREDSTIAVGEELKETKDYRPASPYLVYSPRQVILAPGETQRIRFFVKRDKMTEGEYRSHILISGKPVKEREKEQITEGMGGTVGVIAQAGIPVMVRHGKTTVEIEPEKFELIKLNGEDYLHAKFINKGSRTVYAKPTLFCERPGVEKPEEIGAVSVRIYQEAVYFDQNLRLMGEYSSLDSCKSIRVDLTDKLDFEYRTKPFYSQVLK
jgi:hypothetical protein